MKVSVLIPYRPDNGPRDRIWAWLRRRYALLLPAAEVVASDDLHQTESFNRGQARNLAAERAGGDVFVIGDADTAANLYALDRAIWRAATTGGWFAPDSYTQLSEQQTGTLLDGRPDAPIIAADPEWVGEGSSVAPILVMPRDAFETVGGYDERYPGWGSDDRSFQVAMDSLYQPYTRWAGGAFHLWHPRAETHDTGARMTLDYLAVEGDREKLLKLREGHLVR